MELCINIGSVSKIINFIKGKGSIESYVKNILEWKSSQSMCGETKLFHTL